MYVTHSIFSGFLTMLYIQAFNIVTQSRPRHHCFGPRSKAELIPWFYGSNELLLRCFLKFLGALCLLLRSASTRILLRCFLKYFSKQSASTKNWVMWEKMGVLRIFLDFNDRGTHLWIAGTGSILITDILTDHTKSWQIKLFCLTKFWYRFDEAWKRIHSLALCCINNTRAGFRSSTSLSGSFVAWSVNFCMICLKRRSKWDLIWRHLGLSY